MRAINFIVHAASGERNRVPYCSDEVIAQNVVLIDTVFHIKLDFEPKRLKKRPKLGLKLTLFREVN